MAANSLTTVIKHSPVTVSAAVVLPRKKQRVDEGHCVLNFFCFLKFHKERYSLNKIGKESKGLVAAVCEGLIKDVDGFWKSDLIFVFQNLYFNC